MRIVSAFVRRLHLEPTRMLLSARHMQIVQEMFEVLDVHQQRALNDLQFLAFMQTSTDLREDEIYMLFDTFDTDASGFIEFDEFYLLVCMMIAIKDNMEKQFLFTHARTCFQLLDADGSRKLSVDEFQKLGFLFGFSASAITSIFREFDVSGDRELDLNEFRLFTLGAIEKERQLRDGGRGAELGQRCKCALL